MSPGCVMVFPEYMLMSRERMMVLPEYVVMSRERMTVFPGRMIVFPERTSWDADLGYAEREIRSQDIDELTPSIVVVPNHPVANIANKKA